MKYTAIVLLMTGVLLISMRIALCAANQNSTATRGSGAVQIGNVDKSSGAAGNKQGGESSHVNRSAAPPGQPGSTDPEVRNVLQIEPSGEDPSAQSGGDPKPAWQDPAILPGGAPLSTDGEGKAEPQRPDAASQAGSVARESVSVPPTSEEGSFFWFYTPIVGLALLALVLVRAQFVTLKKIDKFDELLYGAQGMTSTNSLKKGSLPQYGNKGLAQSSKDNQTEIARMQKDLVDIRNQMNECYQAIDKVWKSSATAIKQLHEAINSRLSSLADDSPPADHGDEADRGFRGQGQEITETPDEKVRAVPVDALADSIRPGTSPQADDQPFRLEVADMRRRLEGLEERLTSLSDGISNTLHSSPLPAQPSLDGLNAAVEAERRLLDTTWMDLYDDGDMGRLMSLAVSDSHAHQDLILTVQHLTDNLKGVERLGPAATETATPLLRYQDARNRFRQISQLRSAPPGIHEETFLDELKKANLYLGVLRFSEPARDILRLDINGWLLDHFPSFADTFYREYQVLQRRGRVTQIEGVRELVDKVLSAAGLRVIEITLGRTLFDDRCHIARSTSSDMSIPDGTIAGVIRNGFEKSDGGWTLHRQAEVIVNRI
jgi:hypothetical protein